MSRGRLRRSSGERGRRLFRAAKGIPALTSLLRGDSWGEAREERPEEDLEVGPGVERRAICGLFGAVLDELWSIEMVFMVSTRISWA